MFRAPRISGEWFQPEEPLLSPIARHAIALESIGEAIDPGEIGPPCPVGVGGPDALRRCGLRQCRYIGEAKAHLQHLLTAAAINVVRLSDWWTGTPLARTRCSRFAALQPAA
jgi:hypothetical protein